MIGSANEISALATKAARGAGAPPAQAAQFGQAAVRFLAAGHPADLLSAALQELPKGPIIALPYHIMRILETATGQMRQGAIPLETPLTLVESYLQALAFHCTWQVEDAVVRVTVDTQAPARGLALQRVTLEDQVAQHMQTLAARTFVPETEASRLAGAGAGLTDND